MRCMGNICSSAYFSCKSATLYIQRHDLQLRLGHTLDSNFEASFTEQDGYFPPLSAGDGFQLYFHEL